METRDAHGPGLHQVDARARRAARRRTWPAGSASIARAIEPHGGGGRAVGREPRRSPSTCTGGSTVTVSATPSAAGRRGTTPRGERIGRHPHRIHRRCRPRPAPEPGVESTTAPGTTAAVSEPIARRIVRPSRTARGRHTASTAERGSRVRIEEVRRGSRACAVSRHAPSQPGFATVRSPTGRSTRGRVRAASRRGYGGPTRPSRIANWVSSATERRSSLRMRFARWVSTVRALMSSSARDLLGREPARDRSQHLALALGQRSRAGRAPRGSRASRASARCTAGL